jgi:dihydroorotate dehydrogenase (fumarate)
MADLSVKYLGLTLKNPIIVGSSNLSSDLEMLKRLEKAGAAAVVYKSLFEEQIHLERANLKDSIEEYDERHAEMTKIFPLVEHGGPKEHLFNLKRAKETLTIPLIASLNAIYTESWVEYAQLIAETGVDGLELNFYFIPRYFDQDAASIEQEQIDIFKEIKKSVKIPLSVKLSPYYTNPLNFIKKLDDAGAKGFVLFNRMFQPEIDLEREVHTSPFNLSQEHDHRLSLRFAGMLHDQIQGNICSATGVLYGKDIARLLLAGADCVQVVSSIYRNKPEYLKTMLEDLQVWMKAKNYDKISDFKGKLSNKALNDPFIYKRAQYVDIIMKSSEILKKYPMV